MIADKGLILYVGPVEVPGNSAAARRIIGNAKAFQHAGYDVMIGGAQVGSGGDIEYEGITIFETGERKHENLPTALKYLAYARMGKLTMDWLNGIDRKIEAIILYSGYSPYLLRLLPWCKKRDIPLVFDAVEWYEAPSKLQAINPYYWNIELAMRYLIPKTKNVICISSYLQHYYDSKNCNTVICRPLLDVDLVAFNEHVASRDDVVVSYTGNPGKKDLFDNYLSAIISINQIVGSNKKIVLKIAGIEKKELLNYPSILNLCRGVLPSYIETLGRVTPQEAQELTSKSHFSLLLRPINRVSSAGFPTKVVESLAVGTPVILNLTSDLGQYINNGEEGFICKDETAANLSDVLREVLELQPIKYLEMRKKARIQAESSFNYIPMSKPLLNFITKLKKIE